MRKFVSTHWKTLVVLLILAFVALLTLSPTAANADSATELRRHVHAVATGGHNSATPADLERAARYIDATLGRAGYTVTRQSYRAGGAAVHNIEVSLANVAGGRRPDRIFIVGAHYDAARDAPGANDHGSGTAAVLELARLMRQLRPAPGTELKFVFFVTEGRYPDTGNFIAFVGTRQSSALVGQALAAFRAGPEFPAHGLAAPAYVQGVTLSDHASYNRFGYPALMIITDTAFLRYPYHHAAQDTPDKLDYDSLARVVKGLAHTIGTLAGTTRI